MNNINFKRLSQSWGYRKLKIDIIRDCVDNGGNCFNVMGCNQKPCKCFHAYCDRFKWVIDRLRHYKHKYRIDPVVLLNAWEKDRKNYWYIRYYNDSEFDRKNLEIIVRRVNDVAIKGNRAQL